MRRLLPLFLLIAPVAFSQTVTWTNVHQTIDGFGSQTLDYANSLTSSQADQFFLSTGSGNNIGLSIVRTANRAAGSGSIPDLVTLQEATARGALLELSLQSPPASIKQSGAFNTGTINGESCVANTQSTNYTTYATYIVNYINTIAAAVGHRVDVLDVQNEPNITSSGYGACLWTAAGLDNFIKNFLGPAFTGASWNGTQGTSPRLMMPSGSGWVNPAGPDLSTTCLNDASCAQYVNNTAYHGYSVAGTGSGIGDYALGRASGRHLWMSETDYQCGAFAFDASMTNGLVTAQSLHNYLTTASVSAWEYWELIYANSSGNCGLWDDSFNIAKRFYVNGNWSKFVRPGWVRIDNTACPSGVLCTAFKDPVGGGFAIVAVNTNGATSSPTITLSGFPSITSNQVTPWLTDATHSLVAQTPIAATTTIAPVLPANSVTTFVGSTSSSAPPWTGVIDPNRAIDWRNVGMGQPLVDALPDFAWPNCTTVQAGTTMPIPPYTGTAATITSAIAACHTAVPTGVKVPLASGVFALSTGIVFPSDTIGHIALIGQGASQTKLSFTSATCGGFANGFICASSSDGSPGLVTSSPNPNVVTVSSGFAKGSTQLVLSSISTAVVGSVIVLNQCDTGYSQTGLGTACTGTSVDNGGYFTCQDVWTSTTGCAIPGEGGSIGYRIHATEFEAAVITGISGTTVTLSKPIEQPNWSTAQGVQAAIIQPNPLIGIENLSIDSATIGGTGAKGIFFAKILHGWISGVSISNSPYAGIHLYTNYGMVIKDSYFYGQGLGLYTDHNAIRADGNANLLFQNNIFHDTRGCLFFSGSATVEEGDVFSYNYCALPGHGSPALPSVTNHGSDNFILSEGNITYGWNVDGDHSLNLSHTSFRDLYTGWLSCATGKCASAWSASTTYCTGTPIQQQTVWSPTANNYYKCTALNTNDPPPSANWSLQSPYGNVPGGNNGNKQEAVRIFYGSRYGNYIDLSLGTPGYSTVYQCNGAFSDICIYMISGTQLGMPIDPELLPTTMFWGNWDTTHSSSQFNNSEVPTAAPTYPNPVPATHTTPCSFYINCASKPLWFGTAPLPLIGHDVVSGNVGVCSGTLNVSGLFNGLPATNASQCAGSGLSTAWGGTVNANAAMAYYLQLGGLPDGTGPILTAFDASHYGPGGPIPNIVLTPSTLPFGNQNVNTTSAFQTINIASNGTANLIVSSITLSGPFANAGLSGSGFCTTAPFTLAPGASCNVGVTFSPLSTGAATGAFSVNDNAPGSPHTVNLTGTGTVPIPSWAPTSYAYGSVVIGTPADSAVLVLNNTGTGPLNVSLTITGANPTFFSILSSTCSPMLAAGATCQAIVEFTPTAASSYSANLTNTDSVQGLTTNLALTGTGVTAGIITAPCITCIL